jgi:hypothetical protein
MFRMPIQLFDLETQRAHKDALEKYEEESKAALDLGTPWPAYPKAPTPMADSQDPGQPDVSPFALGGISVGSNAVGKDPTRLDVPVAHDGTSESSIKGFESLSSTPFTVKR